MSQDSDLERTGAEYGRAAVYRGAATAVALAWSMRLIGLVSVLVLARLLSPADFGIVGLAAAFIALIEVFSSLGLRQALLRTRDPDRSHYDTAWTIQLLVFVGLAVLVAALGPLAASFYQEPALGPVLAVLSLRFLLYGLINIGIVDFDRNLDFGRDLRMRLVSRIGGLVATVALAVWLQSYWALAIGLVCQSALHVVASYVAHPFRPRFSLARRSEMLGVSIWILIASAAQVAHRQVERLVIGRFAAIDLVGLYSVSKDLSAIFTEEIATALNRVTFVTTARTGRPLRDTPDRLPTMLGAYAMIAAPLGLGLAATAEDAVAVLLGDQWAGAAPLLQLIAPASALYAVYKLIASSLQASGMEKGAASLSCAGAAVAAAALIAAALNGGGAIVIAATALIVSAALLATGTLVIARVARTSAMRLGGAVVRPFTAALAMLVLVRAAAPETGSPILDLAFAAAAGGAAYFAALLLGWIATGRPRGAESDAVTLAAELLRHASVQWRARGGV